MISPTIMLTYTITVSTFLLCFDVHLFVYSNTDYWSLLLIPVHLTASKVHNCGWLKSYFCKLDVAIARLSFVVDFQKW